MRKILDEQDPSGVSQRERIFRHQLEVAQAWEVRIVGKDGDGELLKVASGRDSTAAAEFVFGLIGLKPQDIEKNKLALAEHIRQVCRDQVEIGRQLIGKQAETWSPEQIRAFWDLCERDPSRFLRAAAEQLAPSDAMRGNDAVAIEAETGRTVPTITAVPEEARTGETPSSIGDDQHLPPDGVATLDAEDDEP